MQFLRDVKPNWTESQIYYSTKAHFGKSFTLYEPKFEKFEEVCYADTPDDSWTVKSLLSEPNTPVGSKTSNIFKLAVIWSGVGSSITKLCKTGFTLSNLVSPSSTFKYVL